jgi:hypothetical protein
MDHLINPLQHERLIINYEWTYLEWRISTVKSARPYEWGRLLPNKRRGPQFGLPDQLGESFLSMAG